MIKWKNQDHFDYSEALMELSRLHKEASDGLLANRFLEVLPLIDEMRLQTYLLETWIRAKNETL
jgi:hypothetical protein